VPQTATTAREQSTEQLFNLESMGTQEVCPQWVGQRVLGEKKKKAEPQINRASDFARS
jgi:hypothetical protein